MKKNWSFAAVVLASLLSGQARAQIVSVGFDESGNIGTGTSGSSIGTPTNDAVFGNDSGPGWNGAGQPVNHGGSDGVSPGGFQYGASGAGSPTNGLFNNAVQGDVVLIDPVGGGVSDVIRFTGPNPTPNPAAPPVPGVFFFSSNVGGITTPADFFGVPGATYANNRSFTEIPLQPLGQAAGSVGYVYTPGPGDPGFIAGRTMTYTFVSEGTLQASTSTPAVPEPSSMALAGVLGVVACVARFSRRFKRAK